MTDKIWDSGFQQTPGSRKAFRKPEGLAYFCSVARMYLNRKIPIETAEKMINTHFDQLAKPAHEHIEWINWFRSAMNNRDHTHHDERTLRLDIKELVERTQFQ